MTKPALAGAMIIRALDTGVHARWVAADEVYGGNPSLRNALQDRGIGYVLAVACDHQILTTAGRVRADALTARLPARAWQQRSAGHGSKGPRFYDWAQATIEEPGTINEPGTGEHRLLIRRNNSTGELAYYRCWTPGRARLADLVRVAGRRWTIEESFQTGKTLTGLDQHQVRRWTSWRRWTLLAMLAHAFLAVTAATERAENAVPPGASLIALTCNEIHRLFNTLIAQPVRNLRHRLHWSIWRRRHQHRARTSHYHHRQALTT